MSRRWGLPWIFGPALLLGGLVFGGCALPALGRSQSPPVPAMQIELEPAPGTTIPVGQQFEIVTVADDPGGVGRVEFYVNGQQLQNSPVRPPFPQSRFIARHPWVPDRPGNHTIQVINRREDAPRQEATLIVVAEAGPTYTPTPAATRTPTRIPRTTPLPPSPTRTPTTTSTPTITPTPTRTPTPTVVPGSCNDKAQFVAHVTIPPGSQVAPGASFLKTWRVTNSGSCHWNALYKLVFEGGNRMGGQTLSLPNVAVGQTVDLSPLRLEAPATAGDYTGIWRLQSPAGVLFGPPLEVNIRVP
ncbi:MAG: NBR1-Ig-like domain-containing protein [Anaerolineae bacterium]